MIQYMSENVHELIFSRFIPSVEIRDEQWVDIELRFEFASESDPIPEVISELTALVICTHQGAIAQIVPQDEGCDCEFQFTPQEKEQITQFVLTNDLVAKALNQQT